MPVISNQEKRSAKESGCCQSHSQLEVGISYIPSAFLSEGHLCLQASALIQVDVRCPLQSQLLIPVLGTLGAFRAWSFGSQPRLLLLPGFCLTMTDHDDLAGNLAGNVATFGQSM